MKTVVIAGGNSGMGKASAILLAKKGYRVIIHGRDPKKTETALKEIIRLSGNEKVDSATGDLASIAGMKKVTEMIRMMRNWRKNFGIQSMEIISKYDETIINK